MMYTSPKFEFEEEARSQVEHLQNQPRLILGHGNCSNGWRKYMSRGISMNRRYYKPGWGHCNHPKHESKQVMQQPIKRIASDLQCLKLVMSAHASVASCLNIIDRKVACFEIFPAGRFIRSSRCCGQSLWRCRPFCKTGFQRLDSNLVKCTSLDFSRCVIYSGRRFRTIRAANKKIRAG